MGSPPGIVTFLFTDIEGSTRLWDDAPDRMRTVLAEHDQLCRSLVHRHRGEVVSSTGDGFFAVFPDPLDALRAVVAFQQGLQDLGRRVGTPLRVRCGLHAGVDGDGRDRFSGPDVNRASRIMSAAHGGQVLLSEAVRVLLAGRGVDGVSFRDLGVVRLRDVARAEHLHQVVHPTLPSEFPALRGLASTPHNLPQSLTSFVGRERELAELQARLRESRLLTLCGAGGIGKTRLALHLAAQALDMFPDGAWLVELAPISDPRLVPQAIATALGVTERADRPLAQALLEHVRDRRLLIVLDNCEHLLASCAHWAKRLLDAGRAVTLLATSRESLHLAGESTYPLTPLAVPDAASRVDLAHAMQVESLRLLVERATSARHDFRLTDRNLPAALSICRHLDGIPLALELAAARVRALSLDAIDARLGDRFRLLTRGDSTAIPRQQTLRALIDWSYDLLSADERALFRRLAVFAGGWTLEAAERVGADAGGGSVLEDLTSLVEKSLIAHDMNDGRYGMLESVRQYAHERLVESGDERAARQRHLAHCLALAEQAKAGLRGPAQAQWVARLDVERENILAAHAWCAFAEDGAEADLALAHDIKLYWFSRGLIALGHRFTVEAVGRAGAQAPTALRARGLFDAGQICTFMGRNDDADRYLQESLAIARDLGDQTRISAVLQPLGLLALSRADFAAAHRYIEEGVELARRQSMPRETAAALNMLGTLHRVQDHHDVAAPLYEEVVAIARSIGDHGSVAIGLLNLAMVAIARRDADAARRLLREIFSMLEQVGSSAVGQSLLDVAAGLAALDGAHHRVARWYGAAQHHIADTGFRRDAADEAFLSPFVTDARGALGEAEFVRAEAEGRALGLQRALDDARAWVA
jgi:predicted ATPase/class 3 adenylate cyclase